MKFIYLRKWGLMMMVMGEKWAKIIEMDIFLCLLKNRRWNRLGMNRFGWKLEGVLKCRSIRKSWVLCLQLGLGSVEQTKTMTMIQANRQAATLTTGIDSYNALNAMAFTAKLADQTFPQFSDQTLQITK